jgi:thymidylate kinase
MTEHNQPPHVSIPELLDELNQPHPTVIAFEGGPCGGKTTIVNRLAGLSSPERPVVVLPEAATQHIEKLNDAGVSIPDLIMHDRQGFLALEADILNTIVSNIELARITYEGTDALIVADRTDIGAYVTADEYRTILKATGRQQPPHLDLVDKMVYLPSLAREDAEKYTQLMTTNSARYESAEDAVATCVRNLGAVALHPELSVHWGGDFDQKVTTVLEEVMHPEREIEAKYTQDPSRLPYDLAPELLRAITDAKLGELAITQSYHEWEGEEFRLRRTVNDAGHTVHHYTIKTGQGSIRHEVQRIISPEQYNALKQAPEYGELVKRRGRYLINLGERTGKQHMLHADFYDDRELCVLEFEGLTDEDMAHREIPGFVRGGIPARELVQ